MNIIPQVHTADVTYPFVEIGKKAWMLKNLEVTHFRNGDLILEAKSDKEWKDAGKAMKAAWCYYKNESQYGEHYGKLYNWFAVADERGLAPEGWHVPSDEEWTKLTETLGGRAGLKLKSAHGWEGLFGLIGGNGDNSSQFFGLPAGYRVNYGGFNDVKKQCLWWSTNEDNQQRAWYRYLNHSDTFFRSSVYHKTYGFSVRCLKD